MFDFLKRNKSSVESAENTQTDDTSIDKTSFFQRLKLGLTKTRKQFTNNLANLVLGKKEIDAEVLTQLEDILITADMGVAVTQEIIANLTERVSRKQLNDPEILLPTLKQLLLEILNLHHQPLTLSDDNKPNVILVIGVNGVGKTTTIGKLAHFYQTQNKRILLAAGDTFRAAAIEQLQVWGQRNDLPVIAQQPGSDSASVIFDALQAAQARTTDILIADTAGRLHTKANLMEELRKVQRVLKKLDSSAPHEVLLVLDAGNGQNALAQAKQFHEAIGITGIVLTKLDGTARGGIIFAIVQALKIPIYFIGVGEQIDDLRPFHASDFVDALFD
jgi:fused signal recognition particle receptor